VAHNFNNLLTVILGNLDLAAVRVDAASRTGVLLRNAIDAAQKSATIARQLLTFARRQPSNPRPVDTARLLNEIAAILHDMLPPAIRVELEIASNLRAIRIDPVDFELTLLNLAINARDAMPNGGHLRLQAFNQSACDKRLGLNGEFVVLEVKDDGEGMSAETRANVFEPFFTTKPIGSGTGLGLSQVHGFVHQAGGAVDIESALGRGTCIRLYLPVAEQQVRAAELRQKEVSS
jgi:signal transduction histidine kinase